ncbi:MAG: serine/threonine-protein kinase [Anaerolineae bacterium]|nr:serine/threonine-protein kinase [Anaerolineae bacterium]
MDIRDLAGRQIDEYTLVEIIGEGGMSAVYRAYQEELDRHVAVKILSSDLARQPDYLQRFNQEAKMAASLEHPHIVPVYDFGVNDDVTFVVMRLLNYTLGQSHIGAQHINDLILMVEAIAKALDYAHSRGIIHRDVKPNNIMFDGQQTPYLVDFGIAKAIQADLNLTADNIVMGTPSFMSPEQWRGDNISPKVDQYGLAVVLFHTLTGELPFAADSPSQIMYKHLNEAPPNATDVNPNLPPAVNQVLQRAMSKDPNYRYPLVSNFSNALKEALTRARAAETALHQSVAQVPVQPSPPQSERTVSQPVPSVPSSVHHAEATYQNMARVSPPQQQQAVSRTRPPQNIEREQGQKTIMMRVAQGGMLGVAALLLIAILIIMALLMAFAPNNDDDETNTIATQPQVVNPTRNVAQIAITSRADATATFDLRGAIITPAVGIVGMNASLVRQVAILIPNSPIPVRDAVYSPDGVMVAAGDGEGIVKLWRAGINGTASNLRGHSDVVSAIAFNPDGSLLASAGRDMTIRLWDTGTGQTVSVLIGHTGAIRDIAFSPNGQILASGAEDGTLRLWNISTGQVIRRIAADSTRVLAVAFSPEGQTVASGGRTGIVRLWNPENGAEYSNLAGHSEEIRSLAFSPDGQFIASSSTDNSAIIWRRGNGQRVHTLLHERDVFAVSFSPDSTLLATGGRDNNLRLWDVATGQEVKNLTGHGGWVLGVSFAPDGRSLITGSGDGSVRIWRGN